MELIYEFEFGKTLILFRWGVYLSMGQSASTLTLMYYILFFGYHLYLRCAFYCAYCITMQNRSKRFWRASNFVQHSRRELWTANKVTAYYEGIIFDTTLGYPGEG